MLRQKNIKDSIQYLKKELYISVKSENLLGTIVNVILFIIEIIFYTYLIGVILFSNNIKKLFYVSLVFIVLLVLGIYYKNFFFNNLKITGNRLSTKDIIVNSIGILYDDKERNNNNSFYLIQYYVGLFLCVYKIFGIYLGRNEMEIFF